MRLLNRFLPVLGGLWLAGTVFGVPANLRENYQPIVDRNPFGLRPPPPPPTNAVAQPPPVEKPKVEIFLTGITSIGYPKYPKQVFLKTQEANKKNEPQFYALQEGVEKDGIKVLSIDDRERRVRIQTDAGETVLSFQTHGIAAPAAPAQGAPGMPGHPGVPGQPGAMPQPIPGGMPQAMNNPAMQQQGANLDPNGANAAALNNAQNFRSIPSRSVRSRIPVGGDVTMGNPGGVPGGGMATPDQQVQPQLDPAEQYLRMHLDKTQKERQGIPMPPLPVLQ